MGGFIPEGFIPKKLRDAKTARFCGEVFNGYTPLKIENVPFSISKGAVPVRN